MLFVGVCLGVYDCGDERWMCQLFNRRESHDFRLTYRPIRVRMSTYRSRNLYFKKNTSRRRQQDEQEWKQKKSKYKLYVTKKHTRTHARIRTQKPSSDVITQSHCHCLVHFHTRVRLLSASTLPTSFPLPPFILFSLFLPLFSFPSPIRHETTIHQQQKSSTYACAITPKGGLNDDK